MSLRRLPKPRYARRSNIKAAAPHSCSVSRIADQRLARPEQQHQQNAEHAHNRENRLLQNDLDHAGPEPWRRALHPGLERLLAGLMDVVPELTNPGETQGLVGDPARAVVDHENESAGQEQKPDKSEKTADHASPYICRAPRTQPAINGMAAEIKPHQHLTGPFAKGLPVRGGAEAVDAAKAALYKSANGGGRNPAAAVSLSGAVAQACLLPPAWQSQEHRTTHQRRSCG